MNLRRQVEAVMPIVVAGAINPFATAIGWNALRDVLLEIADAVDEVRDRTDDRRD